MYSVLNALSEYTYFYIIKDIIHTLFCLFLRSSKAFSISLNDCSFPKLSSEKNLECKNILIEKNFLKH